MNRTTGAARFAPTAAAAVASFDGNGGAALTAASSGAIAAARRMPDAGIGLVRGKLMGNVAATDHTGAAGWALDEAHPNVPVAVELVVGGRVVAHALADLRRPDLAIAGVGDGSCGFNIRPHRPLPAGRDHLLQVRRVGDGADVPGSPLLLPRATGSRADFEAALAQAATNRHGLAAFLAGEVDRLLHARANRPPHG